MHRRIMWVMMMPSAIGANRIIMMMPITMLPIQMMRYAVIRMPPYRPIIPIERRMPCYPRWSPKPIVNHRTIYVYGLNNVISTIYIFITYHLHCYRLRLWVFLYKNRSYILINILCQHRLDNHQVAILVCCFYNTQIVYIAISIKV